MINAPPPLAHHTSFRLIAQAFPISGWFQGVMQLRPSASVRSGLIRLQPDGTIFGLLRFETKASWKSMGGLLLYICSASNQSSANFHTRARKVAASSDLILDGKATCGIPSSDTPVQNTRIDSLVRSSLRHPGTCCPRPVHLTSRSKNPSPTQFKMHPHP